MTTTLEPSMGKMSIRGGSPHHPEKHLVTLDQARAWSPAQYLIQRKYDGCLRTLDVQTIAGTVTILCEHMHRKSGGFYMPADLAMFERFPDGWYAALTIAAVHGETELHTRTANRWNILRILAPELPKNMILAQEIAPENIGAALAAGAEGICAHLLDGPWGTMECHKVLNQWLCRVTARGATQSVTLADAATNEPRGKVKMAGGRADRLRVGSLVKIEGLGLTDAGLIREPRPCLDMPDSWLIRF